MLPRPVFVLDDWDRPTGPTRKWLQIVGSHIECCWDSKKQLIAEKKSGSAVVLGIVVIHRSVISDYGVKDLEPLKLLAKRSSGLICIVISGAHQADSGVVIPGQIFVRHTPVNWPQDSLF